MIRLRVRSSLALACLALFVTDARAEPRAVIELFTSQACSSCPPADKLLGEYARNPSVVALSLPINYWDYLGWKDTLALNSHTIRQRAYAKVRGDRKVYTPQAVINGVVHALGSDKAAIDRAIQQTHERATPLSLPVSVSIEGDKIIVKVPAAVDNNGPAEVWLCPMRKMVIVAISRGENQGRMITYTNVVRRWIKLGDWSGKTETFSVPIKDFQTGNIDSAAVVVQSGATGAPKLMLGAAQIALR